MFTKPCFLQWFLLFHFVVFLPLSSIFGLRGSGCLLLYPFRLRRVEICKIASSFSSVFYGVSRFGCCVSSRRFAILYSGFFTPPSYFSFFFFFVEAVCVFLLCVFNPSPLFCVYFFSFFDPSRLFFVFFFFLRFKSPPPLVRPKNCTFAYSNDWFSLLFFAAGFDPEFW